MSRQPPETAVQFGRVNRVQLAREIAQEAINRVGRKAIQERVARGRGPALDLDVPGYVDIDNEEQRKLK